MNNWFSTSRGKIVVQMEMEKCVQIIPENYYDCSLQVGLSNLDYLEKITISHRFFSSNKRQDYSLCNGNKIDSNDGNGQRNYIVAEADSLPFAEKSCDLIILPHTLDFCSNPHDVLRQANQILAPEGVIVLIGFNFLGAHTIRKYVENIFTKTSDVSKLYTVERVQDWLTLLGVDVVGAAMIDYGFPVMSDNWSNKLLFLEQVGDRWWPSFGGVYIVVGKKHLASITTVRKSRLSWQRFIPSVSRPVH